MDQTDFGFPQTCLSGPSMSPQAAREKADFDADNDVDGEDLQLFIGCTSGAGTQVGEACFD